jgi:hypothetical protein
VLRTLLARLLKFVMAFCIEAKTESPHCRGPYGGFSSSCSTMFLFQVVSAIFSGWWLPARSDKAGCEDG